MRNLLAFGLVLMAFAALVACGDKNEKPPLTPDSDHPALTPDADGGPSPMAPTK